MNRVEQFNYLELFFSADISCEQIEIINLADFTIVASDVYEESDCSTLFFVHQFYSKSSLHSDYGDRLFDYREIPTAGVWQNNTLILYQQITDGYLRLTFFVERQGKAKIYHNIVEVSLNGDRWKKYAEGKYGWV